MINTSRICHIKPILCIKKWILEFKTLSSKRRYIYFPPSADIFSSQRKYVLIAERSSYAESHLFIIKFSSILSKADLSL